MLGGARGGRARLSALVYSRMECDRQPSAPCKQQGSLAVGSWMPPANKLRWRVMAGEYDGRDRVKCIIIETDQQYSIGIQAADSTPRSMSVGSP